MFSKESNLLLVTVVLEEESSNQESPHETLVKIITIKIIPSESLLFIVLLIKIEKMIKN